MMRSKANDRKCVCKLKTDLEYLVAVPGCSDDLAAVSSLPEQWSPRPGGPILAKYLKDRDQSYQDVLRNIMIDAQHVNKDIDEKVRVIAETLLADIKKYEKDIDASVKEAQPVHGALNTEDRNKIFKQITNVYSSWVQDLTQFKQEANGLERQRVEGIKTVLKKHFQNLIKIGHKSPKDMLHEFDERMYEINQQLLSNCRAYAELEAQLRSQADTYIIRARSRLNELCLDKSKVIRGGSAFPWYKESFHRKRSSSLSNEKIKRASDSSSPPSYNMEEFKDYIAQLVNAYRAAVLNVCTDFSGELTTLQMGMTNSCMSLDIPRKSVLSNIQLTVDQAFKKFAESYSENKSRVEKILLDITFNDVINMQKSLCNFANRLQSTFLILQDAGCLWDDHILRSALSQKLTMAGVEDLMTSHDSMELSNEITFNVALEQLRLAPDMDKLQQQYENLLVLLDRIEEGYQQHHELEIKKLEDYMNLIPILTSVLKSEYECFFEKYPKSPLNSNQSLNSSPDLVSPRRQTLISLRAPLPRVILQTHLQDVALYNWRNGFLESLQNNISSVAEKVNWQTRKWIDERTMQVNIRHSLKLMSHCVRQERVKAAREARLHELKIHENCLTAHVNAINKLVDNIPLEVAECFALDSDELYPLHRWVKEIQLDMDDMMARDPLDPEIKRLKMSSYAPRLVKHRQLFEKSLDVALTKYKKNVQERLQLARISTFQFISHIKLPIEDGNYAAPEASKSTAALLKAFDALELCANRIGDVFHHRRIQLLASADQLLYPLQKAVEEVFKFSARPGLDKKKSAPMKKK
ncbi:unnamed protein product [Colias eurytheme]|nr:unnamed protein product [Colias eurytheme]